MSAGPAAVTDSSRRRRFECKYVIDEAAADAIRAAIRPYVEPDPHAVGRPDRSYEIRSLYLDAPDLRLFWETEEGQLRRLKLRVRHYPGADPDAPVFLEIKRRYDRVVMKDRAAVGRDQAAAMLAGGDGAPVLPAADQACCDEFRGWMERWLGRPVVWVRYRREAYVGSYHRDLRITFDRDLCCAPADAWEPPPGGAWRDLYPWAVVLELKFDTSYPQWLQRLVQRCELRQRSFSKYGQAVRRGVDPRRLPGAAALGLPTW